MTAEELIKALDNAEIKPLTLHHDEYSDLIDFNWGDHKHLRYNEISDIQKSLWEAYLEQHNIGDYEEVDQVGGHEGGGEHFHVVYHFKQHNVYLRADGWYQSYSGIDDVSDWYDVEPKEVLITVYEKKEEK